THTGCTPRRAIRQGACRMTRLTPLGLFRILGQVTVIMFVPILGGTIVGIVLDRTLGTTPVLFLAAFGLGNLVAILGIALLIRSGLRKYGGPAAGPSGPIA
ncbi:MAG TPA: AtpZ/AtpI family protein, partial [Candidatus Dormibacteraeota bacterium]|nr:AtpZ/AtpI family protein [Candidatus Dormibacteraeota bacterium]